MVEGTKLLAYERLAIDATPGIDIPIRSFTKIDAATRYYVWTEVVLGRTVDLVLLFR